MMRFNLVSALVAAAMAAALPLGGAAAQTAPGGLPVPPPPGPAGAPRPAPRMTAGAKPSVVQTQKAAKPTAAERAEQLKLEHDLHICIGC